MEYEKILPKKKKFLKNRGTTTDKIDFLEKNRGFRIIYKETKTFIIVVIRGWVLVKGIENLKKETILNKKIVA